MPLARLFEDFAERLNGNVRLRSILAGWKPAFHIESRDTGETFQIHIEGGRVQRVVRIAGEPADGGLLLRADEAVLQHVFCGKLSPLAAYTDGLLEAYGPQKDQIKLDVIALVLWRA
jgi:hypothetical protein